MAASTYFDQIQQLYIAYFGRPADTVGLAYWSAIVDAANGNVSQVIGGFSASTESTVLYAGATSAQKISSIYLALFNRLPEAAGLAYWVAQIDSGKISQAQAAYQIQSSAGPGDATAVANKLAAARAFTAQLDTPAEIAGYTGTTAAALARGFLASVDATPASLTTATAPAALTASVAAASNTPTTPTTPAVPGPQTYTLTATGDTIAGAPTNDSIISTVAGGFASGDVIDGGAGIDTLTVSTTGAISSAGVTVKNVEIASFTSAAGVDLTTTGWVGLTSLSAQGAGILNLAAAATASVSATDTSQLAAAIVVNGGTKQTVVSAHNTGGTITLGAVTPATSAIAVTSSVDAAASGGLITVNGGATVSVTQTSTNAAGTNVTAESAVTVNGSAATTAVSVTQAPVAVGTVAVAAVTGVAAVAAVSALPGRQAVVGVAGVNKVNAVAAVAGVTANGAVTITDAQYNTGVANTIASVTLNNYGAGSQIRSSAMTSLALAGTAGTLVIDGGKAAAAKSLDLTVNSLSGSNTITDTRNEITTLNVTTTGAASTLSAFADTALTKLTVAGSQAFTLNTINSSLASIAISGTASFSDGATNALSGFAALGKGATLTTTSTGRVTASIDGTTQSFDGSSGASTITILATSNGNFSSNTIKAGSGTADELILSGGNFQLNTTTTSRITGFEILGISNDVTGPITMSLLPSSFNTIHFATTRSDGVELVIQDVVSNTTVALDTGLAAPLTLQTVNAGSAATDVLNVVLGTAALANGSFTTIKAIHGPGGQSVATLNVVSNGQEFSAGSATANKNTLGLVADGLSTLNLSGSQGLLIKQINETANKATTFNLKNDVTSAYGVVIGDGNGVDFTDSALTSLNVSGSGNTTIRDLIVAGSTSLTISNTGAQTVMLNQLDANSLSTLTLNGNVQLGTSSNSSGFGLTTTSTSSLTVNGATDNAHVQLALPGVLAGQTHSINLGNGNNQITDLTVAGTVNVTLGTGANSLTLGQNSNTSGVFNITLGAGTDASTMRIGTVGNSLNAAANYTLTGAQVGDQISFAVNTGNMIQGTLVKSGATTMNALLTVLDAMSPNSVVYASLAQDPGYVYVAYTISTQSANLNAGDTSVIRISGEHTFSALGTALTILS